MLFAFVIDVRGGLGVLISFLVFVRFAVGFVVVCVRCCCCLCLLVKVVVIC